MAFSLNDFEFIRFLGKGAYSRVSEYKVREDLKDDHFLKNLRSLHVAIKQIPTLKGTKNEATLRGYYIDEKRILESLPENEKEIMKYYGASKDDSFYYLLLQVGAEKSLNSNLRKIHSSINTEVVIDRIRSIARFALAGLMKLHKTNIIHQDIKLQNIILTHFDGQDAKNITGFIADFGTSYLSDLGPAPTWVRTTYMYADPQQFISKVGNKASDVYSMGITIISICLGKHPLPSETSNEISRKKVEDGSLLTDLLKELREQSRIFKKPQAAFEDLLLGMVDKNPNLRFTAEEAFNHPFIQNKPFTVPLRKAWKKPQYKTPSEDSQRPGSPSKLSKPDNKNELKKASHSTQDARLSIPGSNQASATQKLSSPGTSNPVASTTLKPSPLLRPIVSSKGNQKRLTSVNKTMSLAGTGTDLGTQLRERSLGVMRPLPAPERAAAGASTNNSSSSLLRSNSRVQSHIIRKKSPQAPQRKQARLDTTPNQSVDNAKQNAISRQPVGTGKSRVVGESSTGSAQPPTGSPKRPKKDE